MTKVFADVPLESEEQATLVDWLELVGLRFSAIPMSTYTSSHRQKRFNHAQGVRPGVPDLIVIIPPTRSKDGVGHLIFCEMKRRSGGVVSQFQKDWIAALNGLDSPNVEAAVAKGSEEAMTLINKYLRPEPISPF